MWTPASPWGTGLALGTSVLNAATQDSVAGTFSYTAQSGTGTATTVTAASTLAAGTYTLTATFSPVDITSYATATATRTVIIQAADFTVESSTTSLTLTAGSSGTLTVSVPALYGFAGTVALAAGSPLPGGFTVTAAPASIAAGGTSTITIQTSGLNAVAAIATRHDILNASLAGGVVLCCFLILPVARRRKSLTITMLGMVAMLGVLNGCGGAGFSTVTVTVASSATKAASGSAVSFTATIASQNSKPGGSVTFYNGSTALGAAVPLTNGTASLSTATLPVGLDSVTAVYSGDSNNSSATSSAVAQLVTGQTTVEIDGSTNGVTHALVISVTLQ